ncbi:MAG: cysteine desulfurase [Acidobacteria bacterium]|nr:cysteine desulfurase [Acidobacteriota bacterium]
MTAYLDHAATSPLRPEALEAMLPWLAGRHGNSTGVHGPARRARQAVEEARDEVAALLGCSAREVVFTSGGTEADNLAVAGRTGSLVCSAIEHHAVLDPVVAAGGWTIPVSSEGAVEVDAIPPGADFVSVMAVNNETGVCQPLAAVRAAAPDAVFHTDAVQAAPWVDVAEVAACADLVSVSAHKFGGPQGVGALIVREGVPVTALLRGGGQERERRSGTHNVAGIVGFATALRLAADRATANERLALLRDRLVDGLVASVPGTRETGDRARKVPGICSLVFDGIEGEALLVLLDREGIAASAASSCASGAVDPSHVLMAMGVDRALAFGSLRLSLGWDTTEAEVDQALAVVPAAVQQLRRHAA